MTVTHPDDPEIASVDFKAIFKAIRKSKYREIYMKHIPPEILAMEFDEFNDKVYVTLSEYLNSHKS